MERELKLRIPDRIFLEKRLLENGGEFLYETDFQDTYFRQPKGQVLKIVEKNTGNFINVFRAQNGTFEVVKDSPITDIEKEKAELTARYGIKSVLKGKRRFFRLEGYQMLFNSIDEIGDFLVITGADPSKELLETRLGIHNPEYISVPFDELPRRELKKAI